LVHISEPFLFLLTMFSQFHFSRTRPFYATILIDRTLNLLTLFPSRPSLFFRLSIGGNSFFCRLLAGFLPRSTTRPSFHPALPPQVSLNGLFLQVPPGRSFSPHTSYATRCSTLRAPPQSCFFCRTECIIIYQTFGRKLCRSFSDRCSSPLLFSFTAPPLLPSLAFSFLS